MEVETFSMREDHSFNKWYEIIDEKNFSKRIFFQYRLTKKKQSEEKKDWKNEKAFQICLEWDSIKENTAH